LYSSLRTRLSVLVAASVLPLGVIAIATAYLLYMTERHSAEERLLQVARSISAAIDSELRAVVASAQVLALSNSLAREDFATFREKATATLVHLNAANVVVLDRDGTQKLNTAVPVRGELPQRLRNPPVIAANNAVFSLGVPQIADVFVGPVLQRPSIGVFVPVKRSGVVVYDLAVTIFASRLSDVIRQQDLPIEWTVGLFDSSGTVVARNRDAEQFVGRKASPTLAPALRAGREQLLTTTTFDGVSVLTAVAPLGQPGWSVAVGVPDRVFSGSLAWAMLVLFGAIVLTVGVGAFAASRLATGVLVREKHRDLLINELNHRVKNTLVLVQSLAVQTLKRAPDLKSGITSLGERILALSRAHDVLTRENWESTSLDAIVTSALQPFGGTGRRIEIDGPPVRLRPKAALAVGLVVHELATNALKYGALAHADGNVSVRWTTDGGRLAFDWQESGAKPIAEETRPGFGSVLISGLIGDLGGTVESRFNTSGLICHIEFALDRTDGTPAT
jgi:two-component sensor histidine kinase